MCEGEVAFIAALAACVQWSHEQQRGPMSLPTWLGGHALPAIVTAGIARQFYRLSVVGCGQLPCPKLHRALRQPVDKSSSAHLASFCLCLRSSAASRQSMDVALAPVEILLSGCATVTSRAPALPSDQTGTKTSAGRLRVPEAVKLAPCSSWGFTRARWQVRWMTSRMLLWRDITSDPLLHVNAWWPWGSSACPGQSGHSAPDAASGSPRRNFTNAWTSSPSNLYPSPCDGVTDSQYPVLECATDCSRTSSAGLGALSKYIIF